MARFTLHVPASFEGGRNPEALEHLVMVRDGFSWTHALFGAFAFFVRGFWRAGLIALVIFAVPAAFGSVLNSSLTSGAIALVLIGLTFGFEASTLERFELRRRGLVEAGVIIGTKGDTLEREAIARLLEGQPAGSPVAAPFAPNGPFQNAPVPKVLGLFPQSGGRA